MNKIYYELIFTPYPYPMNKKKSYTFPKIYRHAIHFNFATRVKKLPR